MEEGRRDRARSLQAAGIIAKTPALARLVTGLDQASRSGGEQNAVSPIRDKIATNSDKIK
jgi:hypothetical protein